MSAEEENPQRSSLKSSLNTKVAGAKQKMGNVIEDDEERELLIDTFADVLSHVQLVVEKATNKEKKTAPISFATSVLQVWKVANEIGNACRPFPTLASALVILHKAIRSDRVTKASNFNSDEEYWLALTPRLRLGYAFAAFLLAAKVEETPLGTSSGQLWKHLRLGRSTDEEEAFQRSVRALEPEILVAVGFDPAVYLPHVRVLRIASAYEELKLGDEVTKSALELCTMSVLSEVCLYDAQAVAVTALYVAESGKKILPEMWWLRFHLTEADIAKIGRELFAQALKPLQGTPAIVSQNAWEAAEAAWKVADEQTSTRPLAEQAEVLPCRKLSVVTIGREINKGTYGTVWEAEDKGSKEKIAVKMLHRVYSTRDGFRYYVLREMLYLCRLNHPNIIRGLEVLYERKGEEEGEAADVGADPQAIQFYIVMEFVDYDLLHLMLKQNGLKARYSVAQVKDCMMQLLSGVQHMHSYNLLHRDLKLANILMTKKGCLKVADLGSIRDADRSSLKMTLAVVSLFYRPPELLLRSPHYTTTLDIWSIGCLFYELLTYRRLFAGKDEYDMIHRILRAKGAPSPSVWKECYSQLPSVVNDPRSGYRALVSRFPDPRPLKNLPDLVQMGDKLPESAVDLLERMLDWDPRHRITAQEALRHPFFTTPPAPETPIPFPDEMSDDESSGEDEESFSD